MRILKQYAGLSSANVSISSGSIMPAITSDIAVNIVAVPGLSPGTATPYVPVGTPSSGGTPDSGTPPGSLGVSQGGFRDSTELLPWSIVEKAAIEASLVTVRKEGRTSDWYSKLTCSVPNAALLTYLQLNR